MSKPSNLLRWLFSPWSWVLLSIGVRLAFLLALPAIGERVSIVPTKAAAPSTAAGWFEFLEDRVQRSPLTEDEHCYDDMAKNLVAGRGFVMDTRWLITTPGQPAMYAGCTYPLFVAGVYAVFGAGAELPLYLLQILLHGLAAAWVFRAAARLGGHWAGALAAAFYTFHPMLVWSSVAMMSESLSVPLVAAVAALLIQPVLRLRHALVLAGLLAVLCLARATFAYFLPFVAGWLLWRNWRVGGWLRFAPMMAFVGLFVILCAPWTIRNYVHWGRFIPFSTKSGTNAWMHNHPGLVAEFGPRAIFGPQPIDIDSPAIQNLANEAEREDRLMELFRGFVKDDPGKFAKLVWLRFWMSVLPMSVTSQSLLARVTAWYAKGVVLLALGLGLLLARAGLWRRMLPWLLLLLVWHGLQSLAGPGLRYRVPADPLWACVVGVLIAVAVSAWTTRARMARRWLRRS